jgi:hypothetical protein
MSLSEASMKYFPLLFRLRGEERFLIWMSGDTDSVMMAEDGYIPSFATVDALRGYANVKGWEIEGETPVLHDLDRVAAWVAEPVDAVNCVEVLNAWNLFADICATVNAPRNTNFEKLNSQSSALYDRVFWGNNLPAVTPKGERFVPTWTRDEIGSMAEILSTGLDLLASCVRS